MLIFVTPSHGPISIWNRLLPMFVVINTFDPERRTIFWFIRLKRAGLLCLWKEENSNNSELCTHAMDEHTLQMNASRILGIRVRTRAICLLWMNVRIRLNVWFKNWFYNLPMCFKRANILFVCANLLMVWVYSAYTHRCHNLATKKFILSNRFDCHTLQNQWEWKHTMNRRLLHKQSSTQTNRRRKKKL